jgi:hypothetical protein
MREISSEKAEDESVNIDDTIESETFSDRRFQVKELILDYENKKNENDDQTIFPINGLQKEYLLTDFLIGCGSMLNLTFLPELETLPSLIIGFKIPFIQFKDVVLSFSSELF